MMNLVWKLRIWNDTKGQDLIEYALMAGFVAVAAGTIMPGVSLSISRIFSKISSSMTAAANQGKIGKHPSKVRQKAPAPAIQIRTWTRAAFQLLNELIL